MEKIIYIRNTFVDDQNLTHIDCWFTDEDDDEGKTIAVVDMDTKKVIFFDNDYRNNSLVLASIKEVLNPNTEAKQQTFTINVSVKTKAEAKIVIQRIQRGIYKELDSPPLHIAPPKNVIFFDCAPIPNKSHLKFIE
jgi:hypothetical protein